MSVLKAPIINNMQVGYVGDNYKLYFYPQNGEDIASTETATVYIDGQEGIKRPVYQDLNDYDFNSELAAWYVNISFNSQSVYHSVALSLTTPNGETQISSTVIINKLNAEPEFSILIDGQLPESFSNDFIYYINGEYTNANFNADSLSWVSVSLKAGAEILVSSNRVAAINNTYSCPILFSNYQKNLEQVELIITFYTSKGYLLTTTKTLFIKTPLSAEFDFKATALSQVEQASLSFEVPQKEGILKIYRVTDKEVYPVLKTEISNDESNRGQIIDYSIAAGEFIKYLIYFDFEEAGEQKRYSTEVDMPILAFDNIYLIGSQKLLTIKYNPELTSLKWNYSDTITPTLGGAYPVINRVGNQKYKTFTIGGLLSYNSELDYELNFELDSVFGNTESIETKTALNSHFLTSQEKQRYVNLDKYYQEALTEKLFRDRILAFLQDGNIKLFKSLPEGNMLIRLSNITLTSNKTLDRNIYSFTAQATEIADASYENCLKYGVAPIITNFDAPIYYNEYIVDAVNVSEEIVTPEVSDSDLALIIDKVSTEI